MSYNGSGTFQINSTGQPVVTGTVISSSAFNALTADLATGLSTAITKDGQTTTTARIPFAQGINSSLATDTTNGSSGSIYTAGGIGITKGLFVGGTATFSATPVFSALTASSAVATDASKNLVSVTNTGTGNNVLATSPTLVTPALGTPSSGVVTNLTGTASININGTVGATTASTGSFTSLAYTTTLTGGTGIVNLGSGQFYKDASGNVGIGTAAPDRKLYIAGGARTGSLVSDIFAISDGAIYTLDIPISTSEVSLRTNLNNLSFQTVNSERMRIDSSGNVGIGTTSPNASAILDAQSTTKGVRMPNMTTTQKNAISSPAAGLMVFDTTLAKLCVYSGSAWQTITSV